MNWWDRYRKYIQLALAVIVMIMAITFINNKQEVLLLKPVVREFLAPMQTLFQAVLSRVNKVVTTISSFRDLRIENKRLKDELSRREFVYNLLQEIRAENTRLLKLVNFQESIPEFETLTARVVAREPGNWYNTITINRGYRDGLKENMPVITHQGLVGKIISLTNKQAEVLLLLDQRSSVGGMIQTTRDFGIVKGFAGEKENLRLLYLPRETKVQLGETVVTSGLGGVFPRGLVIGNVTGIEDEDYGLAKYVVIEPTVDFDHLEEVLVIVFAGSGEDNEDI